MTNSIGTEQRTRRRLQLNVNDLSGGFVVQAASYDIDERFLADIQNMELVQGMWQKRKGYHLTGSFTGVIQTNPSRCRGLHLYNSQGSLQLLGVYDNKLYETKSPTVDSAGRIVSQTIPVAEYVRFCNFRNKCFIVTGKDKMLQYDGNKLSEVDTLHGSLLSVYDNRLIMSGIKGDDLVLYYSEQGKGNQWNPLNYILLEGGQSERVTALYSLQGKLFIFTNKSIYSLIGGMENFAVSKEVDGVGAISQEALTVFGNQFYFIAPDGKFYEYDGSSFPLEISSNISHYIQAKFTYNDFKFASTVSYKHSVWFTLDNDRNPQNRITLVYYPNYQAWTKFVGIGASAYIQYNNTLLFTGSNNEGSIYQYGTQYRDDTSFIEGYFKTVEWDFNYLENLKRFKELYIRGAVQGGAGNGFDLDFYVDQSQVASIHVASDIPSPDQFWSEGIWGEMYWGYAAESAGTKWGQGIWNQFDWNGAEGENSPKWGTSVWGAFEWGDNREGTLQEDVGLIYQKLYLSQYNVISGKKIALRMKDKTPGHGFRFENLTLMYIQKGAR